VKLRVGELSGAYNFEVALRVLENLCTRVWIYLRICIYIYIYIYIYVCNYILCTYALCIYVKCLQG
jgi:hypothetical protein